MARVREPIQTYLSVGERSTLDRLAREMGLSRAEVLRRGLMALAAGAGDPMDAFVAGFDASGGPRDLAEGHDRYLAEDVEREWHGRRRSS